MRHFLANDSGRTKTQCLLADSARILALASTGTIKLMRVSEPEATARLHAMHGSVSKPSAPPSEPITPTRPPQ